MLIPRVFAPRLVVQGRPRFEIGKGVLMARSKSKHQRVRHKIRLRWKKRLGRKKAAEKASAPKKKK